MARDKAKDDAYINCDDVKELTYVANLYGDKEEEVLKFLLEKCEIGSVNSVTHKDVYERIEKHLGLKMPD